MTYTEATAAAGSALAAARARRDSLTVEQAAVEAWEPGGPSVDDLARRIAADRGHLSAA